jgi:methylglutaconyl-CoA hydratase
VVTSDALDNTVAQLLKALLSASPHAVKQAKRLVQDVASVPLTDALVSDTVERIAAIRASQEGREGVQAFLEKRKPSWLA